MVKKGEKFKAHGSSMIIPILNCHLYAVTSRWEKYYSTRITPLQPYIHINSYHHGSSRKFQTPKEKSKKNVLSSPILLAPVFFPLACFFSLFASCFFISSSACLALLPDFFIAFWKKREKSEFQNFKNLVLKSTASCRFQFQCVVRVS